MPYIQITRVPLRILDLQRNKLTCKISTKKLNKLFSAILFKEKEYKINNKDPVVPQQLEEWLQQCSAQD